MTEAASFKSFAGILSSPVDFDSLSFASSLRMKLVYLGTTIQGKVFKDIA